MEREGGRGKHLWKVAEEKKKENKMKGRFTSLAR